MHDRAQDTQLILKLSRPGDLMDSAPQEALESSREESSLPPGRGVVSGGQNELRRFGRLTFSTWKTFLDMTQCTDWANGAFYVARAGGSVLGELDSHLNCEEQQGNQRPIIIQ